MSTWQRDAMREDIGSYPIRVLQTQTGRYINQYVSGEVEEPEPIARINDPVGRRHAIRRLNHDRIIFDPAQGMVTRQSHVHRGRTPVVSGSTPRILMSEEKLVQLRMTQNGHPFNTTAHRRGVLAIDDDLANAITSAPH